MHPYVNKIADNRKRGTKKQKSLLLREKVPRNEADEEGVKWRCAMEKFVYVTDTSSTASGPPSPLGKALVRDLLFGQQTEVYFVTVMTSGHVDNVRVANYASLPAANIGAPTPTIRKDDRRRFNLCQ